MLTTYLSHLFCAAALLKSAYSQKSVPADLSVGFDPSSISMQAAYGGGEASEGFADGTKFTKAEVANAPAFAFGDSSGISSVAKYTILMLDTTCDSARTLHFLQTDFVYDGTLVNIASSTKPLQAYQAPGAFKETGNGRKYTFLMYSQPGNENISSLKLPNQGDIIDVKQFQDDNGYVDAQAGVGMVVDLGGTTNCGGAATSGGASSVAQSATSAAASSAAASSAAASSAAASGASSADSGTESPSATAAASSSAGGAAATTVAPGLTTAAGGPGGESSGLVVASSVLGGSSKTTLAASTTGRAGAASGTISGTAPATQTGSEASNLSLTLARCIVVASLIAFAGLLAF
ncbi:uncharacterized protein K441DRAFT_311911 [Cenococcum geophilum 1.58]|uniref:Uncharacterized protein n=1 Tax=Cenococcum geophilum 1.58 TaxID=794803 RepID=A0ACC8EQA7_9PEZI|nr:hypothetical protein K441DRAFT_311911 [Cenococcum geophilum 1.58]